MQLNTNNIAWICVGHLKPRHFLADSWWFICSLEASNNIPAVSFFGWPLLPFLPRPESRILTYVPWFFAVDFFQVRESSQDGKILNISAHIPSRELTYPPDKAYLKMIFLFPRWDMLIPRRVLMPISIHPESCNDIEGYWCIDSIMELISSTWF